MFCVSGRRDRSVWSDICHLLLSSFVCSALIASVSMEHVPGAAVVTIITTSNLSPSTICDPKLLAAPSGICNIDTIARNGIKATHYCNMLRLLTVSLKQNYLIGTLSRQCPDPSASSWWVIVFSSEQIKAAKMMRLLPKCSNNAVNPQVCGTIDK